MISSARIFTTSSTDPHVNLAAEELLQATLTEEHAILFLWQNAHTVVIGAGQNAWRECRTSLLEAEGGKLARRASGGGAVYHDMGNLNFSIILPRADYDLARQASVVVRAVSALGVNAGLTGRNDITTADGRKFSGNAFRFLGESALHHGTLLVNSDMEKVARYLIVHQDKLKSKGVKSVPARVVNIGDLCGAGVSDMSGAMIEAFRSEYGGGEPTHLGYENLPGFPEAYERYSSWQWTYGASPSGNMSVERRFPWGYVEIIAEVRRGTIESASVYTDSMDETLAARLSAALAGCRWAGEDLSTRARDEGETDIAGWLAGIT